MTLSLLAAKAAWFPGTDKTAPGPAPQKGLPLVWEIA
jgi:hypothetical protein